MLNRGTRYNRNDEATLSSVVLNSSTSTLVKAAGNGFLFFSVSNVSNHNVWLKLQSAATDNDKKGIYIPKGSYWEMSAQNNYEGEISAISQSNGPTIYITQY